MTCTQINVRLEFANMSICAYMGSVYFSFF